MNRHQMVQKTIILISFVTLLSAVSATPASAHNGFVHEWIMRKAVDYIAVNYPDLLDRYPLYSYIPWMATGSQYADGAGRVCRWKWGIHEALFGYVGFCDTIHHYGYIGDLTINGIAIAHPGDFSAIQYANVLFGQAIDFWPGGEKPNLNSLPKKSAGSTGIASLTTKLGTTYVGGEPFCELEFPGQPKQCPRWPDWASSFPTDQTPNESVQAALTYLGWSIHLIEDLTNCGHARNLPNAACHETVENAVEAKIKSTTTFNHLPILAGGRYKYANSPAIDDPVHSWCGSPTFQQSNSSFMPWMGAIGYQARDYGSTNPMDVSLATEEKQLDAAIKLVASMIYLYFSALEDATLSSEYVDNYYIRVGNSGMLALVPDEAQERNRVGVRKIERWQGRDVDYVFNIQKAGADNVYLSHMKSSKPLAPESTTIGETLQAWGTSSMSHDIMSRFEIMTNSHGNYYIVQSYSGNYLCVDHTDITIGMNSPFDSCWLYGSCDEFAIVKLCDPPQLPNDGNYQFTLEIASDEREASNEIRDLINAPPSLVIGFNHSYGGADPHKMRLANIGFLDIERPWFKHGGDLGMEVTTGFYWWMMPPASIGVVKYYKLPSGVVFALKHSKNQANQRITLYGYDPTDQSSSLNMTGFVKQNGGDLGGSSGEGYYWYESTGYNFDWEKDRQWADRLPRGTVIGLKHSVNQKDKRLYWDGKWYDPATNQSPPPGYARRGCYDNKAASGQGFCWYEKVYGITIELHENFVGIWPRPGVLGDALEWNSDRSGGDYASFGVDTEDPRVCEAYCLQDMQCKAWTYAKPNEASGGRAVCWLKNGVPPRQNSDCCVSGVVN